MHRGLEELLRGVAGALLPEVDEPASRALLARLTAQAEFHEVRGLLRSLEALARTPSTIDDEIGTLGRYSLLRKLPCDPPEQCFKASIDQHDLFVRTFPRETLNDAAIARLKRWMMLTSPGLAQIFDFGVVDHQPYLAGEWVGGIDLRRLKEKRPPLAIALTFLAEASAVLQSIHAKGETHGHLSAGRIRIGPLGMVKLCIGTSEVPAHESAGGDLCALVQLMLSTSIEDPELDAILASGDPDALVVAADALEHRHPELDELIAAVLVERTDPESFRAVLEQHVTSDEALRWIGTLVEAARG